MTEENTNLEIYNKVKSVPKNAQKLIKGGRLKGMTDINPMWRIKILTEIFGVMGFGWHYEIIEERIEDGSEHQKVVFTKIHLFVKYNDEWSKPIIGIGGSFFISKESKGLYTNDECFKMALTDALGSACKVIGIGSNIYWEGQSKYDQPEPKKEKLTVNEILNRIEFIPSKDKLLAAKKWVDGMKEQYQVSEIDAFNKAFDEREFILKGSN